MKRAALVIAFLGCAPLAQAGGPKAPMLNRRHPSIQCAALLSAVRDWRGQRSRENTSRLVKELGDSWIPWKKDEVQATLTEVHAASTEGEAASGRVRAEVRGIQLMNERSEGDQIDEETVVVAIELKGRKDIEAFYSDYESRSREIRDIRNQPSMFVPKLKRYPQAILAAAFAAGWLLHPFMGALPPVAGGLLVIVTEPWSLLRYQLARDPNAGLAANRARAFVAVDQAKGSWVFDAWQYRTPRRVHVQSLWQQGLRSGDGIWSTQLQDFLDSRGWVNRLDRPIFLRRQGLAPDQVRQAIELERPQWVAFDQWLRLDRDSGEPVATIVMRTSFKRPEFPEAATEKSRESSPVLVPSFQWR